MSYNEKKALYNKQWRQQNKEKLQEYSRNRIKNETVEQRQKRLQATKEYKKKHKEEIQNYSKQYLKKFKEKNGITIDKYYYFQNKAKHNQACKDYKNKNKEKIAEYRKNYLIRKLSENPNFTNEETKKKTQRNKVKMQTDSLYRVKQKLRAAVQSAFQRIKKNKTANTEKLLGCSWEEAKARIESLWMEGMSWENHGKEPHCWQIDHIRPVASFKENELDQMNLITNLQPLWFKDNNQKKDKY